LGGQGASFKSDRINVPRTDTPGGGRSRMVLLKKRLRDRDTSSRLEDLLLKGCRTYDLGGSQKGTLVGNEVGKPPVRGTSNNLSLHQQRGNSSRPYSPPCREHDAGRRRGDFEQREKQRSVSLSAGRTSGDGLNTMMGGGGGGGGGGCQEGTTRASCGRGKFQTLWLKKYAMGV